MLADATDFGIAAVTYGAGSAITIENSGSVAANGVTGVGIGAGAVTGSVSIVNSGDVYGSSVGILAYSGAGATVTNLAGGSISAGSGAP